MKLWSNGFQDGQRIPEEFAFGKYHPENHVELSNNCNPYLAWSDLPDNTSSLVLICHDSDAPSQPDDVNQEGKTVAASLPRMDFYHWVLVDLKPDIQSIDACQFSNGVTPGGKRELNAPLGTRQGINSYREWFATDPQMAGEYFGYDGACPPWNDEIVHHYHFTLYAVSLERIPLEGSFTASDVLQAIEGHILDKACLTGIYSINPEAKL
jgi:Raf kinase inhibitor-like YbhB/YbcL family protein